jgi:hypothetical protein
MNKPKRYKLVLGGSGEKKSKVDPRCPSDEKICRTQRKKNYEKPYDKEDKFLINDIQSKKGNRTPSYCDRNIKLEQLEYKSFNNDIISRSDHDLVYSKYEIRRGSKTLRLLFLTWNQGNQNVRFSELMKGMDSIFHDQNIIVFSQQESDSKDELQKTLIEHFKGTYKSFDVSGGLGSFYVRLTVLVKEGIKPQLIIKNKSCLNKKLKKIICSKSVVGISLKIGEKDPIILNLFATHFPVKVDAPDLGYEERIEAYEEVEKFMNQFHTQLSEIAAIDIIGGDLNFRYDTGIKGDQLQKAINDKKAFQGFKEGKFEAFAPTCKMCECA